MGAPDPETGLPHLHPMLADLLHLWGSRFGGEAFIGSKDAAEVAQGPGLAVRPTCIWAWGGSFQVVGAWVMKVIYHVSGQFRGS